MGKILSGAGDFFSEGNDIGVLVIHGFTGSTQSVLPLAEAFAKEGFTVLVPRLTGHGISPEELAKASFQDWLQDVEEALDELRLHADKIFITGLSMGGALTLYLAENYHDILGIMPINAAIDMPEFRAFYRSQKLAGETYIDGIGSDIKKAGVTELAYPASPVKSMADVIKIMEIVRNDLDKVVCPTMIFSSTIDHVVPPANSQHIFDTISSEEKFLVKLEDSYHVATLDNDAEKIIQDSLQFIDQVLNSEA